MGRAETAGFYTSLRSGAFVPETIGTETIRPAPSIDLGLSIAVAIVSGS